MKTLFGVSKRLVLAVTAVAACFISDPQAAGCDVPVFRYALEYWQPYAYEAVVFRREPLTEEARKAIEGLNATHANMIVREVNVNEAVPPDLQKLWEMQLSLEMPRLVLRYPEPFRKVVRSDVLWDGRFEPEMIRKAAGSPARAKVARDILSGISCVWVFVESGNKALDTEKHKVLDDGLAQARQEVKLPAKANEETSKGALAGVIPLKVDFTTVSIARNDPGEKLFADMLIKTEPDWEKQADKPAAFPLFGQGRALNGLIGDGITMEAILNACTFILGSCSCQVKDQNPGVDMLIDADWSRSVSNVNQPPAAPPELVGVSGIEDRMKSPENAPSVGTPPPDDKMFSSQSDRRLPQADQRPAPSPAAPGKNKRLYVLLGLAVLVAVAGGVGAVLSRKKEQ